MGVSRMVPLANNNPSLFEIILLENCQLVIDGKCLEHYLYEKSGVAICFGGNYDEFYQKVKNFFHSLKKAGVEPIIVFDGGYEMDDRKKETLLSRAQKRIENAKNFAPLLTHDTFMSVINNLRIRNVTCDFEADNDIVVLANNLRCPVLSFDSDYFVLEIEKGYIPLNEMNIESMMNGERIDKINVRAFLVRKLYSKFPYLEGKLGLLASAMGNDYILKDSESLQTFYKSLRLPKPDRPIFERQQDYFCAVIRKLMHWIERNTYSMARQQLDSYLTRAESSLLETSLQTYANSSYSSFDLLRYVMTGRHERTNDHIPEWIEIGLRNGSHPSIFKNAILLRRNIVFCQVEDLSEKSSHQCSKQLRQVVYGLLVGSGAKVTEIDRDGTSCVETPVIGTNIQSFLPFEVNIATLPTMELEKRIIVLQRVFDTDRPVLRQDSQLEGFDLYLMIVKYWYQKSKGRTLDNLLFSVLLCFVLLSLQDDPEASNARAEIEDMCLNRGHNLDSRNGHHIARLQSTVFYGMLLNKLLGCPMLLVSPASIMNGTLISQIFQIVDRKRQDFILDKIRNRLNIIQRYDEAVTFIMEG